MSLPRTPENEALLAQACAEVGLQSWYVDSVRPLLGTKRWPRCCGGGCEPCARTLIAVAERVHSLLGIEPEEDAP
ncbi:MAG TPA: hypothetical protein VHE30_05790 [Polyangiaceae bacterium]|nr:hypothetical protein [Polyangiaceae bacterium]